MTDEHAGGRTSVVIATRNRAATLAVTLRRLLELRPRPPIIIADNASTDTTGDVASALAERHDGVRVLRLAENLGAAARTLGVLAAPTPYVGFSDDDSWWASDALPRAEAVFDRCPNVGLIAARTVVEPRGEVDPTSRAMADSPLSTGDDLPGREVLGFLACGAIVRRAAYLDAGGFSRLLQLGAEEKLLAYDLAARGWRLRYVPEVRAHHEPAVRDDADHTRRKALVLRNDVLISVLRRSPSTALRSGLALAVSATRDVMAARALAGLVRKLPTALWQRRRLPRGVEANVRLLER
ncbi:glycosyltransferase family 2 protein [Haloechinothrix salitolerans]|uniref:Glycosyltransferase family 2 protein n=1 Tax=Haloechinothrix salitolerans TaxID=926830 RepID=A0ABW2C296_9PSEU